MTGETDLTGAETLPGETIRELRHTDAAAFEAEIDALVKEAEATRLSYMQSMQGRGFLTLFFGLSSLLAGGGAFGWYFLMYGDFLKGLGWLGVSFILPVLLYIWSRQPIKSYLRQHKKTFMPRMAKALGGFNYRAEGGVGAKIINLAGVAPKHDGYESEDCFIGLYKGIKVIFSEARLSQKGSPVFQGVFALIELPQKILEGHIILTADKKMAQEWAPTRWKNFQAASVPVSNPSWNRFAVFSLKPEDVSLLVGEKLLKELSEAADIFQKAPLTCAFFRGKYVFLMIPSDKDMFEASDIRAAVPTRAHALERRKEIEKLLEIVDVFDIYARKDASQLALNLGAA